MKMKRNFSVFIQRVLPGIPAILVFSFFVVKGQTSLKIDGKVEKYKLVFRTSSDGKLGGYLPKEESERKLAGRSSANNFIAQLNTAGQQNYKLISALPGKRIAIVGLDETQYEYDWFESESPVYFAKSGLREKLKEMLQNGFQLIDHSLLSKYCESTNYEFTPNQEECVYRDFFIFEKKRNENSISKQILIAAFPGWGAKPSLELQKQIKVKLAEGFYPVKVFSAFEMLLDQVKYKDGILSGNMDIQVVRSSMGSGNPKRKVYELAKQGFKLAMTDYGLAVMYRDDETKANPVTYVWLNADKKNFNKELTKLQEMGAIYRMVYNEADGSKSTLIFELNLNNNDKRSEFKVIKFELEYTQNLTAKRVFAELKPSSKQNLEFLNLLAKKGFQVKDMFEADGIKVILERRK